MLKKFLEQALEDAKSIQTVRAGTGKSGFAGEVGNRQQRRAAAKKMNKEDVEIYQDDVDYSKETLQTLVDDFCRKAAADRTMRPQNCISWRGRMTDDRGLVYWVFTSNPPQKAQLLITRRENIAKEFWECLTSGHGEKYVSPHTGKAFTLDEIRENLDSDNPTY